MNVSKTDAGVPRMSRHWKRPVISPRDGFRVQFSSCKLSGMAWMCARLHIYLHVEDWRGQFIADYPNFKMKEKLYSKVKLKGDLILFLLFWRGNLVAESCKCKKKILVKPSYRHWQTIHSMLCAHNECVSVCLISEWELGSSWSMYFLGLRKDFLASMRLCISFCVFKCMCVYCFQQTPSCRCFVCVSGRMQVQWRGTSVITGCCWH